MADTTTSSKQQEEKTDTRQGQQGGRSTRSTGAGTRGTVGGNRSKLRTEHGQTSISSAVVSKIAGLAAREIPGVQSMGTGMSRRMGQLKAMVPGSSESLSQGVAVEVGEKEAALDLDIVTWYGQSIVDVTAAVRENVIARIQEMTGLTVVEVNINVDDVYVEGEDDEQESRVQ